MASNRMKLLEQVVGAIVNLKDARGSPLEKIINYVESSKSRTVKKTPGEIRRTLIYGINHGIIKEQDGRFKIEFDCKSQKQSRKPKVTLAANVKEMKRGRRRKRRRSRVRRRRRHDGSVDLESFDSKEYLMTHKRRGGKTRRRRTRRRRRGRRQTELADYKFDEYSDTISPNSTPIPEDRSKKRKNRKKKPKRKRRGRRYDDISDHGEEKEITPKMFINDSEIQKKIDYEVEDCKNDSEDNFGKRYGLRSRRPRKSRSHDSASDGEARPNAVRKSDLRLTSNNFVLDTSRPSKERSKSISRRNSRSAVRIQEAFPNNFEDDDSHVIPDFDNQECICDMPPHNTCQYEHCENNDTSQN